MAAQLGFSIFPLTMPTSPINPEFLQDAVVQLIEVIASQCAPASGGTLTSPIISSATFTNAMTITDGVNIAVGTSSGTMIGTAASQKLGFFGATPVAQPSTVASAVATTAVTTGTVYGFTTAAQGNALVGLANALQAALTSLGLAVA